MSQENSQRTMQLRIVEQKKHCPLRRNSQVPLSAHECKSSAEIQIIIHKCLAFLCHLSWVCAHPSLREPPVAPSSTGLRLLVSAALAALRQWTFPCLLVDRTGERSLCAHSQTFNLAKIVVASAERPSIVACVMKGAAEVFDGCAHLLHYGKKL